MNLQQLNQSGQNLWVFIVTGVTALLITGVSWLCVEVITSYKGLPRIRSTEDSLHEKGLAFRLALLVWLLGKGHTTWMWRSGAWLCILSNEKLGKFRCTREVYSNEEDERIHPDAPPERACDYVYESLQSEKLRANFNLRTTWKFR